MGFFSGLRNDQKEAVCLLQVGTFLEYFDLMLYVHMAVILNELFFPKTDPHTAALLTAVAFCSTYVMRPFGAILFGYIGDHIGRKTTVIFTTMMMATSCIIMANLPTYAQAGIMASWVVTLCRMFQGISSMGERIGAEIYLTELIPPPASYPLVSLLTISAIVGTTVAIAVASFVTTSGFNWRIAFWIGAAIALVGSLARTRLRETPDFVDMKRRMKNTIKEAEENGLTKAAELLRKTKPTWNEKVLKKTILAYLCIQSAWPVFFYFTYIHCGDILKHVFHYSAEQVIRQNLIVSSLQFFSCMAYVFLSYRIYPLKILKVRQFIFLPALLVSPLIISNISDPYLFMAFQVFVISFAPTDVPAGAIFYKLFPVFGRFTYVSVIFATARTLMYIATSLGLVFLTEHFGYWGLLVIMVPITASFSWGVRHFERLDKEKKITAPIKPEGRFHYNVA